MIYQSNLLLKIIILSLINSNFNNNNRAISVLVKIIKACKESGTTLTQEIFPVMQNIYRKYPGKVDADNSLHELMENLENAEETEPKSAAIWILGEYAEKIKNSVQIINKKIET